MSTQAGSTTTAPPDSAARHGLATVLGVLVTIAGSVGAIVAAVQGADTATATSGAVAALAAVATMGGKYAQAVAAIRAAAVVASPWVDALQAALAATPPDVTREVATQAAADALAAHWEAQATQAPEPGSLDSIVADLSDEDLEAVDGDVTLTSSAPAPDEGMTVPDLTVPASAPADPRPEASA